MKKLLNISVIAALAVLPMAANAATGDIVSGDPAAASSVNPAQADNAVTASASPKYALAVEAATDSTNVATASYVKGAYNAAMKAINKVSETANNAVKGVQVNGADLTLDANGKANVTVAEGSTNGTVAVNGSDVAVHGLGSAAFADTTAFDAAGDAAAVQTAIEGKLDDGATGYDIDAKTLKVQGADVLTGAALTDYAKKTGVTQTITNSTIAGTVPTVTVWGAETAGTAQITASITGATYAEPANP